MGITEIIAKFLGIIETGEKIGLLKISRKYIDELYSLNNQLIEEEAKGDLSDDAKIENIHKRIPIVLDAIRSDIGASAVSK